MYNFHCSASPFPRFEAAFLFLGWGLMFFWILDHHLHNLRLVGPACIWIGIILMLVSLRWNKRPISDKAFSCLQAEARFDAIRKAWESVCGEQRRPTWGEMRRIGNRVTSRVQ